MGRWGNVLRVLQVCMEVWYWEKKCKRKKIDGALL